jgi:hypothetical protein
MLNLGRQLARDCGRISRRELLQAGSLGVLGLSLADLLRLQARAGTDSRAKSVILLWLWGGPSHLDTFDMKPGAPVEYRGPYCPVATNVPGIQICELLPALAQRADHYTIIRSLHCRSNDHGIAGTIGLTGTDTGAISLGGQNVAGMLQPTHGSIVSGILGFDPMLPRFFTIGGRLQQGHRPINGETGGPLGALHDPFRLDYDPDQGVKLPQLELIDGLSPSGLDAREKLLSRFDQLAARFDRSTQAARLDSFYQQAFGLLTSPRSREIFDLEREPADLRRRYGRSRFGQCCLLARRLIEGGARFVQVNWSSHVEPVVDAGDGGWDMHDRHFPQFQDRYAGVFDRSISALLDDLTGRGLLDETIVVAVGEFGRTPKINDKAGRDHWEHGYSGLVAGGGFRAGCVVGQTDRHAEHVVSQPMTPADLFTTVLHQLGIGTTDLTRLGLAPLGNFVEALV